MPDAAAEPFVRVLHPDALKQLTDSPSWERGERYFKDGRVGELARQGGTIKATVKGTEPYEVKIWVKGDRLAYSCTCPSADKGFFCKHCVAVALAWLVPLAEEQKAAGTHVEEPPPTQTAIGTKAPSVPPRTPRPPAPASAKPPARTRAAAQSAWAPGRLHAVLRRKDPADLADLLLDAAADDPALQARLMALLDPS